MCLVWGEPTSSPRENLRNLLNFLAVDGELGFLESCHRDKREKIGKACLWLSSRSPPAESADLPVILAVSECWKKIDPAEIADDFLLIKNVGMNVVRIFLLWEDFQPEYGTVSAESLEKLVRVADIAEQQNLLLDVTFFTGHMSGPNWVPAWLLNGGPMKRPAYQVISGVNPGSGTPHVADEGYENFFESERVQQAQEVLLREVVTRLGRHAGVGIWNLGNEPDLLAVPSTPTAAQRWVARMTAVIRTSDPLHRPVTCGLHAPSLLESNNLRPHEVFVPSDLLPVIHGYPMYAAAIARRPLDEAFVPFLCALTAAMCRASLGADKDPALVAATLAEEFGGCTLPEPDQPSTHWEFATFGSVRRQFMASQQDFANFLELVLPLLVRVGARGAMLWCFADYAQDLYGVPPLDQQRHERHFGLVNADGTLKPHAEVIRRFAATRPLRRMDPATWEGQPDLSGMLSPYGGSLTRWYDEVAEGDRFIQLKALYERFCGAVGHS
ncbi:putative glycosyl hydrolase [Paratrimastix pyriformis]|uniref:Glycosyl hydrolase n=1 Tax=Paratrimastix pyriformis TaxID=342808 RepID=A0ABQ8UZ68_9EUKA|nr:putative glycosyl hydrolase [Paratrimastix pyriformis]